MNRRLDRLEWTRTSMARGASLAAIALLAVFLPFLTPGCGGSSGAGGSNPGDDTVELPPLGTVSGLVVASGGFSTWDPGNGSAPAPGSDALAEAGLVPGSRFTGAVPGADLEIATTAAGAEPAPGSQATTATDGTFTIAGLAAGEYRIHVQKTVNGNLLDATLETHVGAESGTALLVEMTPMGYRATSRYTEAGALVEKVSAADGSSRTSRDGRVIEVTLPGGLAYQDTDGDGSLDGCVGVPVGPGGGDGGGGTEPGNPGPTLPGGATPGTRDETPPLPCPGGPIERIEIFSYLDGNRLFVGQTGWMQALGYDRSGYAQDVTQVVEWSSSNDAVAEVDGWGVIAAKKAGSARISAKLGEMESNTIDLRIEPRPRLLHIVVQNRDCMIYPLAGEGGGGIGMPLPVDDPWYPPQCTDVVEVGGVRHYSALGEFEKGYAEDVTDEVRWTLEPSSVATIVDDGTLTAVKSGKARLSATLEGVSSDALEVTVVTEPTLVAIEIYTEYPISPPGGGPVPVDGGPAPVALGRGEGGDTSPGGPGDDTPVDPPVAPPPDDGILPCIGWECVPSEQTVLVGDTVRFHALGTYDTGISRDLTDSVDWSSSHPLVGLIGPRGEMRALLPGETEVRASQGETQSNPFAIRVVREATAVFLWVDVEGTSRIVRKGDSIYLHATATYDITGLTRDVTDEAEWVVSDPALATMRSGGELLGRSPGQLTVRARIGEVESDPVEIEVWEASDIDYCDEEDVNRETWTDGMNRVILETDCESYARGATVEMRYTIQEIRPNPGALLDPCLDLYVYRGDERVRTIREDGCGTDPLPEAGAAPEDSTIYQTLAFWDQKDSQGRPVGAGTYRIVGRFYIYYDPVVELEIEVR